MAAEIFAITAEALHHPDAVANGDIAVIDDPVHGRIRTIGPLAEFSATPPVIGRPAPRAGEHTEAVLAALPAAASEHNWRRVEAQINTFPQILTVVDGVEFHVIHARSPEPHPMPLGPRARRDAWATIMS